MSAIVIVTTAGTQDEANTIAEELVARRLACCVNILPIMRSVYRWQGKICDDSEYMLYIKSLSEEYPRVEETIKELHSYELPEILSFDVSRGEEGFLSWLHGCVGARLKEGLEETDSQGCDDCD